MITLSSAFMLAIASVAALILTLSHMVSFRWVIRHGAVIDVLATIALIWIYQGTLGGALVGVLGGLFMAMFTYTAKFIWNKGAEMGKWGPLKVEYKRTWYGRKIGVV